MEFQHTNLSFENEYPKLVRDNIPQIIKEKHGHDCVTRLLIDDKEFALYLFRKMVEESKELVHSLEAGNTQEELADIFEIIDAILQLHGWTREEIVLVQQEKCKKRGGFSQRILILQPKESILR